MDLNIKKLHHDVLDTIELVTKKKMEFDWKTLKKSMDAVDKAITTYELPMNMQIAAQTMSCMAFRVCLQIYS